MRAIHLPTENRQGLGLCVEPGKNPTWLIGSGFAHLGGPCPVDSGLLSRAIQTWFIMALSKRGKDEETFYRGWEEEEALKGWVQPVAGDESKVACCFCECEMHADHTDLRQHAATAEHRNRAPPGSSVPLANEGVCASNGSGSATTLLKRTEALHSFTSSPETEVGEADEIMVGNGVGNSDAAFRFSTAPTLEDIRRLQSAFAAERGWGKYHQPRNLLLALVGEVGELAELFQWREEAPEGLPGWTVSERDALSDELSDVLIYLVALADKCHVDLPSAARRKIEKNRLKYPAEKVYGSSKKYTEYQK